MTALETSDFELRRFCAAVYALSYDMRRMSEASGVRLIGVRTIESGGFSTRLPGAESEAEQDEFML